MHPLSDELQIAHRAAILIPLLKKENEWHLLFEVRAYDLDVQPGDVCFPGGGLEEKETPRDAVLRECAEELLTDPAQITLLGALPDMIGPRDTVVTPFAGILHDYRGTFFRGETDRVFSVPLSWFDTHEPRIHRMRSAMPRDDAFPYELIHRGRDYPFQGRDITTYFYEHEEAVIWGFTAKVVRVFLSLKESFLP